MPGLPTKHFLFTALPSWGHIRPFCILAARMVKENENFVVTMIIPPNMLGRAHAEISAELCSGDSDPVRQRLRVLATYELKSYDPVESMKRLAETYSSAYQTLTHAKPIVCAVKDTVFEPVPAPVVVILDFTSPQLQATRAITGHSVPIVAWVAGHASSRIRSFGPESVGGIGDLGAKIDAEVARLGVSPQDIGNKILNHTNGTVINIPGLPVMYDYEFFPQKLPFDIPVSMTVKGCYGFLQECDDILLACAYAFEKESIDALECMFSERKKSMYVIGPLLPRGLGAVAQSPRGANDIATFLDKMLAQHGTKSVLFMSFGTVFWPAATEYIDEVIEALIEKRVPFIFCFASFFAKISEGLTERVNLSGLGLLTQWGPQQFILSHPATGWFLSHAGQNSVMESLACGIPLITWPFEGDQPCAAAYLSENLKVAFELLEVRTGESGLKPLYRNGCAAKGTREAVGVEIRRVLDACRGPEGEEMRRNAEEMKMKLAEAWQKNGDAQKEWAKFLNKHI